MPGYRSFAGFGVLVLGLWLAVGCSSSDEVVAVLDDSRPAPETALVVTPTDPTATPAAATATDPVPVGAGVALPAPTSEAPALFISGTPVSTRVPSAERWPFEATLLQVFGPASPSADPPVIEVWDPGAVLALRELGREHGLATGVARLVVVDTDADQYDLQIWDAE